MNYSCEVIQDLLPLYLDGVCSAQSRTAVEQHLRECPACRSFLDTMREADTVETAGFDTEKERQRAASFKAVKRSVCRRQMLAAAIAVVLLATAALVTVGILKNTVNVVTYRDNVSVSMTDGNLIGRLQGSRETAVSIKRVIGIINGREETVLFFCMSDTRWDALTTDAKVFSEFTLCSADKSADAVDAVYYYTGEYTGIESMNSDDLQKIIADSKLLWKK